MNGSAAEALSKIKYVINGSQLSPTSINFTTFYSKLISCGNKIEARQVFDKLPHKTSAVYNLMLKYYTHIKQPTEALKLFAEMLSPIGDYPPDNYTFPLVFKACGDLSLRKMGEAVHSRVLFTGYDSNEFVQNSLIAMYMNCGQTEAGMRVFYTMVGRNVVSWNTIIGGYSSIGRAEEALMVFDRMLEDGIGLDQATAASVLPVCASLNDLRRGRLVHELVEQKGISNSIVVKNSLVDMYAKCGCLYEAQSIFDQMIERDVVSWTSMIAGYVLNGDARSALALCRPMHLEGIAPNSITVASLLSACVVSSNLYHGKCIHAWVTRCRLESDVNVETSLIDLYAKCNRMDLSLRVFTGTSRKRTVPWNAIISGYVYNGLAKDAIEIFKQMLVEIVESDGITLISLLPAYAALADFQMAYNIHCYLLKTGIDMRTETSTSLRDIYSKCGSLESALEVFNGIPREDKDTITWSAIIAGYGMHGHGEIAIGFYDQMMQAGIKANEVTFTSVLHACSHAGLVDEGLRIFKSMSVNELQVPRTQHYTCIIDLVGRAGRLKEAYELIEEMPFEPNHAVWGALLGACVIHQEVELGEVAANRLFEIEPQNTGNYVLMSKLYSAVGRWEDAENVRNMMKERGLRKTPGCSSI